MPTPMTDAQFIKLLVKDLREVAENAFDELPSQLDELFRVISSEGAWEEFYEIGGVPDIVPFSGAIQYQAVAPGYWNRIEPKEYAGGLIWQRKLLDDKKYDVLRQDSAGLGQAAKRVREKRAIDIVGYGNSSAFTYQASEEGVAIFSDSHTTKSGVSTTTGFDNAGTTALSPTSVAATRLLMRRFKNDIGERIVIEPDELWVPDNLADRAAEIVGTQKGLDSAEGNINTQYRRFKVKVIPRLDDIDSNNWYMVDSKLAKKFLVWIDRVKQEFNTTVDFDTMQTKQSVYARFGGGCLNWRFGYGQFVT